MVGRKVRITGRVQGVFFRQWTVGEASELGVTGWVRNCLDGSVEVHVEGDQVAVVQMIARLREGSPHARVDHVDVEAVEAEGSDTFEIRH